jgi:hypothetical protein
VGGEALRFNTASYGTAVGYRALYTNTTGAENTAVGNTALYSNLGGFYNTAVGTIALYSNTSGQENSAVGRAALRYNTTGSGNTAFGTAALTSNVGAGNNTAVGYGAGQSNVSGNYNVFVGSLAGNSSTGGLNTYLGYGAGSAMTSGAKNTILGAYTGNQGGLDIRTSTNYIVLSDGDGNPRGYFNGSNFKVVGSASTSPVVVTFNATAMTVDCSLSNVFTTTFTANVTTAPTISNPQDGQTINWFITQDGTGGRTMTWPTSFKWPGGSAGSLSTGANAVDLVTATYRSATGFWYVSLLKAFS